MTETNIDKLSNILDINKIERVKKPILEANGLPNECYINQDYVNIERDTVFFNNWSVIGSASSLKEIGDVKPYNFLGIPLLILRDKSNHIKVFHNVCSHRGFKLIQEPCKLKNMIRCPYHSWTYDLSGKLIATPHVGGMNKHETKGFEKSKSNLKEVRSFIGWI